MEVRDEERHPPNSGRGFDPVDSCDSAGPRVRGAVRARGLAAAVTHNGGMTWSSTYPHFSTCAGGTVANGGDFQRASDPWVTFSPNGHAYFISLSLTFLGPASATGSGVLVSKSTDGGN